MGNGWFGIEKDGLESKPQEEEEETRFLSGHPSTPSLFLFFPCVDSSYMWREGDWPLRLCRKRRRGMGPVYVDFGGGFAKSKKKKLLKHHAKKRRMNMFLK